jgi:1,4-dihydroxy-2-naphthoate octaprenyltransferase
VNLLPDKNTIQLLRIPFSFFLMPVFVLSLSQVQSPSFYTSFIVFLIIHVLVYPASNGYNSYIDKDESPIGGLEKPPLPTKQLFYLTLCLDFLAVFLALILISYLFSFSLLLYILASRAYSSKQIRLKKYPFVGFLTVFIFQGAFTFYMCTIGLTGGAFTFNQANLLILCACSFQIAGAYPLTQVYQHKEDYEAGVITLSYKLGYLGTFVFTALMFAVCTIFYYFYFEAIHKPEHFLILQLFFGPIVIYFAFWFMKVLKSKSEANFKNTMRMNFIAACCMNACFFILFYLNQ